MSKRPIKRAIRRQARKNGIRPSLLLAQLTQESGLRENVGSPAGARDIAQFIPSTAKTYGVTLGDNNPYDDIRGAARMMGELIHQYGGNERKALAAYNAGAGAVAKYGGVPPYAETQNYVKSILAAAGKGSSTGSNGPGSNSQTVNGRKVKLPSTTITTPGVDNSLARKQALLSYFTSGQRHQPGGLLALSSTLQGLKDTPGSTETIGGGTVTTGFGGKRIKKTSGTGKVDGLEEALKAIRHGQAPTGLRHLKGVATFEGHKVAAWIAPMLAYARKHGWKGTVSSGYRTDAEQTRIYNSGVRPAAVPKSLGGGGSNHEGTAFPQGAVDVSDAAQLSAILRKSPYAKTLQWAGAKDPVHFSRPHNGSY